MNISDFVHDPGFPVYSDARLIDDYLRSGRAAPPLMTSIGDPSFTSAQVPQRLLDYVGAAPRELHGYQASMGGLPVARRAIASYLRRTTGLDAAAQYGEDFQIALTAGGTRGVIGDFGRLLRDRAQDGDSVPVALCTNPCWDYAGPLGEAGYEMAYWPLHASNGWQPDIADARRAAAAVAAQNGKRLALIIVNAQHNPTGCGWSLYSLNALFELAEAHGAGVLLDDPYFEVRTPQASPVAAPAALLTFLADANTGDGGLDWCAVRSLGKQLGVNGWGVGALTAAPQTLAEMLDRAFRRRFPGNAHHEWALAQYLADPASERHAAEQREALADKRSKFFQVLQELGWPPDLIGRGEFTPYVLVATPRAWGRLPDGAERYRRHLLDSAGILVSHASIEGADLAGGDGTTPWVRFYLGVGDDVFDTILERLVEAGINYDAEPPETPGLGSDGHRIVVEDGGSAAPSS